jgi:Domain of unknown function (DUF4232)
MRKLARVAAAVTVAGLAVGCGSRAPEARAPEARAAAKGVVPWADRPAAPYVEPGPRKFATDARPCRPSDLRMSPGRSGVGLGNTNVAIQFTNRSATECVLLGYPKVAGISASGAITPLAATHGSYFGDPGPPANIAPGQTAVVNVSGADACNAAQTGQHRIYRRLRIGLPSGGRVDAPVAPFDAICGVSVSQFGVPADLPAVPPPSPLTARITAAPAARPGEDFTYTVTLTNPTATPYRLRPCPAYEEYVAAITSAGKAAARNDHVVKNYYLNCDTVHEISARSSVTYQMRLQLPPGLPTGVPAKFVWLLQGPAGPGTCAPLRIGT